MGRWMLLAVAALLVDGCATTATTQQPGATTLANDSVRYIVPLRPYVILKRGDIEAVIVDNSAVDDDVLPGHRAGYNGVASLKHTRRPENLFVPAVAGLNFEHIFDGSPQEAREILFEPRHAPMELRLINEYTAELYQPPTPHYQLESCTRYELLEDGTIEMTFECIPRAETFVNGYIGLFWASYIHQPQSLDIHFLGHEDGAVNPQPRWIRGITPEHGTHAVHRATDDNREFAHDPAFAERLKLTFGLSKHRYSEPWYFGVSHGMALALMFRPSDVIRLTQSPSGGGRGNPAWDFQWYIEDYEVDRLYRMTMRAKYMPFQSEVQVRREVSPHLYMLWQSAQTDDSP